MGCRCGPGTGVTKLAALSFQTDRQHRQATNESNRVFLYCAFLDFRYRPGGWGAGAVHPLRARGQAPREEADRPLSGDKLSGRFLGGARKTRRGSCLRHDGLPRSVFHPRRSLSGHLCVSHVLCGHSPRCTLGCSVLGRPRHSVAAQRVPACGAQRRPRKGRWAATRPASLDSSPDAVQSDCGKAAAPPPSPGRSPPPPPCPCGPPTRPLLPSAAG